MIKNNSELTIGSGFLNDLNISHPRISENQAKIRVINHMATIDNFGKNAIYVGQKRILKNESISLNRKQNIRFPGDVQYEYRNV